MYVATKDFTCWFGNFKGSFKVGEEFSGSEKDAKRLIEMGLVEKVNPKKGDKK